LYYVTDEWTYFMFISGNRRASDTINTSKMHGANGGFGES